MPASRRSDARNNEKLIAALAGVADRRAHYACVLVLVHHADDPEPIIAEGDWHGTIIDAPRGDGGFGYDPHFLDATTGLTGGRAAAGAEERAVASRPRDAGADREAAGGRPVRPRIERERSRQRRRPRPPRRCRRWPRRASRRCRRCRSTCTFRGACASARIAISTRTRRAATFPRTPTSTRCSRISSSRCRRSGAARVDSVFIGGGTPSLFSAAAIDRLLAGIRARVPLAPDAEITLEANPGTFERAALRRLPRGRRQPALARASRASTPRHLRALGRIHDADEARAAAEAALAIFDNVNLDLMYALPEQTVAEAEADVAAALAFAPPHLSFYHLTLEPNTLFHRHPPPLPDDDAAADIEEAVHAAARGRGLSALRNLGLRPQPGANAGTTSTTGSSAITSASARARIPSCRCRIACCARCAGSSRKQYLDAGRRAVRRCRTRRTVARDDIGFEFMLNALRLTEGVAAASFAERTGYPLAIVERELARSGAPRPARPRSGDASAPTALGRRFLNDLQALFLKDAPRAARRARSPGTRAPAQGIAMDDGQSHALTLAAAADAHRGRDAHCARARRGAARARRGDRRRDRGVGASRSGARARRSPAARRGADDGARPAARHRHRREGHHRHRRTCRPRWARRSTRVSGRSTTPNASRG